jgi:hypothetical protein
VAQHVGKFPKVRDRQQCRRSNEVLPIQIPVDAPSQLKQRGSVGDIHGMKFAAYQPAIVPASLLPESRPYPRDDRRGKECQRRKETKQTVSRSE